MTLVTVRVADPSNPVEVQEWLTANAGNAPVAAFVALPYFYIVTNP